MLLRWSKIRPKSSPKLNSWSGKWERFKGKTHLREELLNLLKLNLGSHRRHEQKINFRLWNFWRWWGHFVSGLKISHGISPHPVRLMNDVKWVEELQLSRKFANEALRKSGKAEKGRWSNVIKIAGNTTTKIWDRAASGSWEFRLRFI